MPPAIRVEGLGKSYKIGRSRQRDGYRTLRESLVEVAKAPLQRFRGDGLKTTDDDTFWALKGVDFEVQPGEVVGIIGRNGAGKSTLLKILSRITKPSTGRVEILGRVGSLLEVGTGFHPELTGRENIYLNGSILGMKRWEIAQRFDEIVAFAEVEKFLDTLVKRYSSGMYVRLAFSVAAHLEPEVLIIDEVLAVGDAAFQRKCLGKIQSISTEGRTVLFVSHQLSAVQRFCTTALLLEQGRVALAGSKTEVIAHYLSSVDQKKSVGRWVDLSKMFRGQGGFDVRVLAIQIGSGRVAVANHLYPDGPLDVRLVLHSETSRTISNLAVTFYDRFGTRLIHADILTIGRSIVLQTGRNEIGLRFEALHLNPGSYTVGVWVADKGMTLDHVDEAVLAEVVDLVGNDLGGRGDMDGVVTSSFELV